MKELLADWLAVINNLSFNKGLILIAMLTGCLMTIPLWIVSQETIELNGRPYPLDSAQMRNFVSVELGGNGIIYSLNYSRLLRKRLITRIGFELLFDATNHSEYGFPFEVYSRSISGKHRFELGAGVTFNLITEKGYKSNLDKYLFLRLGYGYQKPGGRFYYRVGFTPFTGILSSSLDRLIMPFGGISVGYGF